MKRFVSPAQRPCDVSCTLVLFLVFTADVQSQGITSVACKAEEVQYPGIKLSLVRSTMGKVFALFKCGDSNKEIRGIGFKECVANIWRPEGWKPRCAPVSDCTRLPPVQNGALNGSYPYRHGDTIKITCNQGYEISGGTSSTRCILRGWSKTFGTCKKICHLPKVEEPLHVSSNRLAEGEFVTFRCNGVDQGLRGVSKLKCLSNGSLSGKMPTCKQRTCKMCSSPSNCRDKTLSLGNENRVHFFPAKVRYFMGDVVQARCVPAAGWRLKPGSANAYKCLPKVPANNGKLEFQKTGQHSEAVCERYGCRPPPGGNTSLIENERQRGKDFFDEDEVVQFTCGPHQLVGSSSSRCRRNSWSWSDDWPTCKVRTCGNLQIDRAKLIFTDESRQTGSSVVVKCDNCTRAFGFQQSYCKANGQRMAWTPSLNQTRCQVVRCPCIKKPLDESRAPLFDNQQPPECGTVVRFRCREGLTLLGSASIQCQEDGRWSDCPPICVRQRCPDGRWCTAGEQCEEIRRNNSGPVYRCTCLSASDCPTCPYKQQVCSSNGKTYETECHQKVLGNCQNDQQHRVVGERGQACRYDGICFLPMPSPRSSSSCIGGVLRWYFNSVEGRCIAYKHGQCFQGLNSFESLSACRQRCIRDDKCSKPKAPGKCLVTPVQRYYYDSHNGFCRPFWYLGCNGNSNHFPDRRSCSGYCETKEMQPKDQCSSKECPHVSISAACQRHDKPVFAMVGDVQERVRRSANGRWTAIHVLAQRVYSLHTSTDLIFPSSFLLYRRGGSQCDCPELSAGKFLIVGTMEGTSFVVDDRSFVYELRTSDNISMLQQYCPNLLTRFPPPPSPCSSNIAPTTSLLVDQAQ